MYLDDVSVHSILASRTGGITTQFTQSQRASETNDTGGSAGIGLGATKATMDSKSRNVDARSSEVLSKAIIQTNFKELYELERDTLAVRVLDKSVAPESVRIRELKRVLGQGIERDAGVFDPASLSRGDLIEVKLALEADPIFHMVSVFSTVMGVFEDNEHLLGYDVATQLPQVASLVRVLEGLLAGLVPVRGRLVEYKYATIGDQGVLIHQKLIDQITIDDLPPLCSAYVVGVAERDLFWKDVRRVLFSGAEYTAFCRVATEGVAKTWHPVKVANVLRGLVPNFDQLMVDLSEMARSTIWDPGDSRRKKSDGNRQVSEKVVLEYVELMADHLGQPLPSDVRDRIAPAIPNTVDWLDSVDKKRSVFSTVTGIVEDMLGAKGEVDGETRYQLRNAALSAAGFSVAASEPADGPSLPGERLPTNSDVVFLDTEIIVCRLPSVPYPGSGHVPTDAACVLPVGEVAGGADSAH